jgi:hypothetical protein
MSDLVGKLWGPFCGSASFPDAPSEAWYCSSAEIASKPIFEQEDTAAVTTFRGRPSHERLLWHPVVHEAYNERCHFYLLSGEDVSRRDTFSYSLRNFLHHQEIYSHTIHAVYGPYDAVLRVWLTQESRLRLLRQLKQAQERAQLRIDDILEFASDQIEYAWNELPDIDATLVKRDYEKAIRSVVAADYSGDWSDEAIDQLAHLREANLVIDVPAAPGVKFYMFLSEEGRRRSQVPDLVIDSLLKEIRVRGIENPSLYFGVGFCDYVLKGVVPKFDDLLPAVNALRRTGKGTGLSPWTLVVADYSDEQQESDELLCGETIDSLRAVLPPSVNDFLLFFDTNNDLRQEVTALSRVDQEALATLFSHARSVLETPDLTRFAEILRSSLVRSRKELNQSLSFLTSIEGDLRFVLPRVLNQAIGEQWLPQIRSLGLAELRAPGSAEENKWLEEGVPLSQWSLMELLTALRLANRQWPSVRSRLSEVLPPGWEMKIRELVGLRNDFAHSRLVDVTTSRDFATSWGSRLNQVVDAIAVQSMLERERSRTVGDSESS